MVGSVVDCVNTDSVDAELLELYNVTLATSGISDRVLSRRRASGLVVDTTDVETIIASKESCKLSVRAYDCMVEEKWERTISLDRDRCDGALRGRSGDRCREDSSNGSGLHCDGECGVEDITVG